jgi:hypothetical protein
MTQPWTIEELAAASGWSVSHLRGLVQSGEIPTFTIPGRGRRKFIAEAAALDYVAAHGKSRQVRDFVQGCGAVFVHHAKLEQRSALRRLENQMQQAIHALAGLRAMDPSGDAKAIGDAERNATIALDRVGGLLDELRVIQAAEQLAATLPERLPELEATHMTKAEKAARREEAKAGRDIKK